MQRLAIRSRLYRQMNRENEHLIEGCRRGERRAQLKLYEQYAQSLYLSCLRIIGKSKEAEEAMQDAFLKIFSHLDRYHEEQNLEAWMRRIAIHTAIDYVRKESPEWVEITDQLSDNEPEDREDEEEIEYTVGQIKRAIQELPAGYRTILSLYLFEGYDMEEIASILQLKPASVRSQYLRAKRKLLNLITPEQIWTN